MAWGQQPGPTEIVTDPCCHRPRGLRESTRAASRGRTWGRRFLSDTVGVVVRCVPDCREPPEHGGHGT